MDLYFIVNEKMTVFEGEKVIVTLLEGTGLNVKLNILLICRLGWRIALTGVFVLH